MKKLYFCIKIIDYGRGYNSFQEKDVRHNAHGNKSVMVIQHYSYKVLVVLANQLLPKSLLAMSISHTY